MDGSPAFAPESSQLRAGTGGRRFHLAAAELEVVAFVLARGSGEVAPAQGGFRLCT